MTVTARRRVGGVGSCPTIRAWYVFPASVEILMINALRKIPAPDDHFISVPNGGMRVSGRRGVSCSGGYPTISVGIVSSSGVRISAVIISAPDDHLATSPDCSVTGSRARCANDISRGPAICAGIISPACVHAAAITASAPYDHIASSPHHGVGCTRTRRVSNVDR